MDHEVMLKDSTCNQNRKGILQFIFLRKTKCAGTAFDIEDFWQIHQKGL